MKTLITILIIINVVVVFYTHKSSVKHNNKIIDWLKQNNDKSGNWII